MAARGGACRAALALLALLLLACGPLGALAACTAGSLTLDLLSTGGGSCDSSLLALCLSSFRIDVDASCNVGITPLLASNVYVPGIWSSNSAGTYTRLLACPTSARGAVTPSGSPNPSASQLQDAIRLAIEQHIYGSSLKQDLTGVLAWSEGTATLTSSSCTLRYAVTQVTPADNTYVSQIAAGAVRAVCDPEGTVFIDGTDCQSNIANSCPGGTRPVNLNSGSDGKACALCRAGTYSLYGSGCTACAAGNYAAGVNATSCSSCAAGTYASTGQSQCLPCAIGTYQSSTGQGACIPCPYRSYARLPGADQCVKCVDGKAYKCINGDCSSDAPTPGYHVLSISGPGNLDTDDCALGALSYANPYLFQKCGIKPAGTTYLSVYVDQYCAVQISPIKDTACSEPGSNEYIYSNTRVRGHYVKPGLIATRLDTSSSYLLTVVPATGNDVTVSYWPATTDVTAAAAAAASTKLCTGTATVLGGAVVGIEPVQPANCPAESYKDAGTAAGCLPCPTGRYCNGTSATTCSADFYQPYLGQSSANDCQVCSPTADPRYTSNAGDDYCLVPYVDTTCSNGQEYSAESQTCVMCPAGTQRRVGREDACTPCAPGYYSPAGATDCTICPLNQFSPVWGLAQRSSDDQKCIYCPTGSVAVNDTGFVGQLGSTSCTPCDPGTYATKAGQNTYHTCELCANGYFRSGDASSTNNECRPIPAGYKEKNRTTTTYDRAEIVACGKGEVSYWIGSTRTPANNPEECQPCTANTYAPRTGMAACLPCRSGTYPTKSVGTLPGNDQCTACSGNTYRPSSSTSATCLVCTAGREVQPSGYALCVACDPGFYMPDNTGGSDTTKPANGSTCLPCGINMFQPRAGQATCLRCPAGTSTQDYGNSECTACPLGYYSPSSASVCIEAPRGMFVNRTGATFAVPCPKGTYSSVTGADECEPCAPGQYSSAQGSTQCRTCPAGTASAGMAATCTSCQPGYSSSAGSGACSPCKPGYFSSALRSATCTRCPKGYQCPTPAIRTPQPCPRGYYSNTEGNRLCQPCPANTYQSALGQKQCIMCPSGFSTRGLTGQSKCQPMRTNVATRRLMK